MFLDEKGLRGKTEEKKAVEVEESELKKMLKDGRERLIRDGWTQCVYENARGSVCALGALGWGNEDHRAPHSAFVQSLQFKAGTELLKSLGLVPELHSVLEVAKWNDFPGRTFAQVIELFDKTIERVK